MASFDYKKEYKDLYLPKTKPMVIQVPTMKFLMVDGKGNPNTCESYKNAMEIMYGISYSIKMSKLNGTQPEGYFDYVVPPLEGLWEFTEGAFVGQGKIDKDQFMWTSLIRQPEFVTKEVFEQAKKILQKKKPNLDLSVARFVEWEEGLCAQILHIGSYDEEDTSIQKLKDFIIEGGYQVDLTSVRRHHEIYLGDPRKTAPEKRKTVIRYPIKKIEK